MTGKRKNEAKRWFQQAYYDLKATRWNIQGGFTDFPAVIPTSSMERKLPIKHWLPPKKFFRPPEIISRQQGKPKFCRLMKKKTSDRLNPLAFQGLSQRYNYYPNDPTVNWTLGQCTLVQYPYPPSSRAVRRAR